MTAKIFDPKFIDSALGTIGDKLGETFSDLPATVSNLSSSVSDAVTDAAGSAGSVVSQVAATVGSTVADVAEKATAAVRRQSRLARRQWGRRSGPSTTARALRFAALAAAVGGVAALVARARRSNAPSASTNTPSPATAPSPAAATDAEA